MVSKIQFKEAVKVLCETFSIKEQLDENKEKQLFMEGIAITFNKPTRNRVSYTVESGTRTFKSIESKPFLDTHHDESIRSHPPFGHVCSMEVDGRDGAWMGTNPKNGLPCLFYRVNLDPAEEEFIRKAKRKDISGTSIQVLVEDVAEREDEFGTYIEASIREFLELSAVLIPGDGDTSIAFAEKFKGFKSEGVISPDGILPKKKVLAKEQDDDEDKLKPLQPLDEPMSKQTVDIEQKHYDPEYDKDDEVEVDKPTRYVGSRETTVASKGLNCPQCDTQLLKDSYDNGFRLRCLKCSYRIVENNKKFKKYAVEAYKRIINR